MIGIQDGFRGLVENRTIPLDEPAVSGILTRGGTILGASRDKPHSMPVNGQLRDMTGAAVGHRPQAAGSTAWSAWAAAAPPRTPTGSARRPASR